MTKRALLLALLLAAKAFCQEAKPHEAKTSQSEIDVLYDQDQKDREGDFTSQTMTLEYVTRLQERDSAHRKRVHELLTAGALKSGKDFEKAAFIFQHGEQPDDFLFAHILAMVAVTKGNQGAIWIAAATLDRYLQKVGKSQVLGTQFSSANASPWTQEPYDRSLVPDSLRRELRVPDLDEQAKRLAEMKNQQPSPK
jgi:hypothetical protein